MHQQALSGFDGPDVTQQPVLLPIGEIGREGGYGKAKRGKKNEESQEEGRT
ncbi:hypothetical protein NSND_60335 [Nitrospira sp. ND1]|nr:hypothetical protein NSND_60335 [Nitrospira sp. ND1]